MDEFGMPTIVWRVLDSVGYPEGREPQYCWTRVQFLEDRYLYTIEAVVPEHAEHDSVWCTRRFAAQGRTTWEGANAAAYVVLRDLMEEHPEVVAHCYC